MPHPARTTLRARAALAMLVFECMVRPAAAYVLRAPQIVYASASLQGLLNARDGAINCNTDQLNAQSLSSVSFGGNDFTLLLVSPGGTSVGFYNTLAPGPPALLEIFPAGATRNYSAACHFTANSVLIVTLYDDAFGLVDTTSYGGADKTHIGFYSMDPHGTWFSQDARNAGKAQVLTYTGTQAGGNFGELFECFENTAYNAATSTFADEVVEIENLGCGCVPTRASTWGSVKAMYR